MNSIITLATPHHRTFGAEVELAVATTLDDWVYSRILWAIGYPDGSPISVLVGAGEYRINNGAWTAESGIFNNGDHLYARALRPTIINTMSRTVYRIGAGVDTFKVDTYAVGAAPADPDWIGSEDWVGAEDWPASVEP